MKTHLSDVLIIGSGFGAVAPALRLSEIGLAVTVVEKGPSLRVPADFKQTQDPKYLLRYLHSLSGDNISLTYAEALGGGSGFYEMVSLRAPSLAFEQVDAGRGRLWPAGLDRTALDPYYDIAETMLEVEQISPHEVPKSGLVFSLLMKNLGLSCDRARYAVKGCVGSGFCVTGCIYGAKRSLHMNYLPRMLEAGCVVKTDLEAKWIRPLTAGATPRAGRLADIPHRYEVICRGRGERGGFQRFRAKLVVLAGGTLGTAALLLRSKEYLRGLSRELGRNIAFNGGVKVAGLLPDSFPDCDMFSGRSHPGMISYHFLESHGLTISAAKPLPLQAVAAARLKLDGDRRSPAHWGEPHVELMKLYRRRVIVLVAFGLTPPLAELRFENNQARLRLPLENGVRSYYKTTKQIVESILVRNGCKLLDAEFLDGEGSPREDLHFSTAHQTGSCRMADSSERGVVDASGEVFGYPGLYVSDGAAIPSSLAVNTSLTILANAERIASIIRSRYSLDRGEARVASAATRS